MEKTFDQPIRDAKHAFQLFYNGASNFMTPDVLCYRAHGRLFFELSRGAGIVDLSQKIYGVTVLKQVGAQTLKDLSGINKGGFTSQGAALDYINRVIALEL